MRPQVKTGLLALAAAIASTTAPVQAAPAEDPVRIGVIDTRVTPGDRDGMDVVYRAFGPAGQPEGIERINRRRTHGEVVLDSIADARARMGDRRRYQVFAANPFGTGPSGSLTVSWKGLRDAVQWFKENGVKVVSTTFAARDATPGMAAFNKAAQDAGMIVVASVGNGETASVPFPAAYPEVIAIDGHHYKQRSETNSTFMARADAVFDGSTRETNHPDGLDRPEDGPYFSGAPDRKVPVAGSSFAAARASAFLAARLPPSAGLADARALVASVYTVRGRPVDLAAVGMKPLRPDLGKGPARTAGVDPAHVAAAYGAASGPAL